MNPLRLRIVGRRGGDLGRQQQRHARLVRADNFAGQHFAAQVLSERVKQLARRAQDVQQRRTARHPATACEPILLAIDREVITVFAGDDFGRDAGVVAIAFDQAFRSRRLGDAARRLAVADVFRDQRYADLELRPLELQRLEAVVADQLPLAVLVAMLHVVGHRGFDFVTRQMLRQLFVARLLRGLFATLVLGHDRFGLLDGVGQTVRRVGHFGRIAEVDLQLIRIFEVAFAAFAKRLLQQFADRELLLGALLFEFRDRLALFADRLRQFADQRLAGGKFVRHDQCITHAEQDTDLSGER